MAGSKFLDKQKVLKFVEKAPFTATDKKKWSKSLDEVDLTQELLEEIHAKLLKLPASKFESDWMRVKYSTDLTQIIKQWRMGLASKNLNTVDNNFHDKRPANTGCLFLMISSKIKGL